MSTAKLTGSKNLTKYAFWLGPGGPIDKKNQVKMYKKSCFKVILGQYLSETVRILILIKRQGSVLNSRIRIKQSDPVKK
jgi:hypothetical protein